MLDARERARLAATASPDAPAVAAKPVVISFRLEIMLMFAPRVPLRGL